MPKRSVSYPRGVNPGARRAAIASQLAMLGKALAPWPRRQAPLLSINCGNGAFLPYLWQCGFDLAATETDPCLRDKARKRQIPGIDIYAASDTDLPFDNDEFDWAILHLKEATTLEDAVAEGARVASRGFMLTFWNTASLPALTWRMFSHKPWADNGLSWRVAAQKLEELGAGRITFISALAPPVWAWGGVLASVNAHVAGMPLGAFCAARLDKGSIYPVTPLPLRLGGKIQTPELVMEYGRQRGAAADMARETQHKHQHELEKQ